MMSDKSDKETRYMSFIDLFYKKRKYATLPSDRTKREVPEGIMIKCKKCNSILYNKELEITLHVCPKCDYHFSLSSTDRIRLTLDEGNFFEYDSDMFSNDPLSFPDYEKKVE